MVTRLENGVVVFRVHRDGAERVELLGSFTGWHDRPIELQPVGGGWWRVMIDVPAGDHEFKYLIDGREWIVDYAASGVELNEFGWTSLLHVPQTKPAPEVTVVKSDAAARQVA